MYTKYHSHLCCGSGSALIWFAWIRIPIPSWECGSRSKSKEAKKYDWPKFTNNPAFLPYVAFMKNDIQIVYFWLNNSLFVTSKSGQDPDPHWGKKLDQDPHWNQYRSTTLLLHYLWPSLSLSTVVFLSQPLVVSPGLSSGLETRLEFPRGGVHHQHSHVRLICSTTRHCRSQTSQNYSVTFVSCYFFTNRGRIHKYVRWKSFFSMPCTNDSLIQRL